MTVPATFLHRADPRAKLALACALSATVTLPLAPLVPAAVGLAALLAAAQLGPVAAAQLRRMRLWLACLFAFDWMFVGLEFAVLITVRLAVLTTAFTLVSATTTANELCRAWEQLGVPRRAAFAFAMAFHSLGIVEREWRAIVEAQRARGIDLDVVTARRWRAWPAHLRTTAALVVPAIVLAVQRAWAISEAAAARGFESPGYRPHRVLRFGTLDHALLAATALVFGSTLVLR